MLTIEELTQIPHLHTRLWAGEAGAQRRVAWAHPSEIENPSHWLGEGDVLMTTGIGIPESDDEQAAYVEALERGKLNGLIIAEHRSQPCRGMYSPPLSQAMKRTADRLGFPILFTGWTVPFVSVVREVSAANHDREHSRVARVLRLYNLVRTATADGLPPEGTLDRIGSELDCAVYVLDLESLEPWFPGASRLPEQVIEPIRERLASQMLPNGGMRVDLDQELGFVLPVPTDPNVVMVVITGSDHSGAALLLCGHIAAIVESELEKRRARLDQQRSQGAFLLKRLLQEELDPEVGERLIVDLGVPPGPWSLAACNIPGGTAGEAIAHLQTQLTRHNVHHLITLSDRAVLIMLPSEERALDLVRSCLRADGAVGFSAPFLRLTSVADAEREAQWALRAAQGTGRSTMRYRNGSHLPPFFPRTLTEARRASSQILGPIKDYDADHSTELVHTLRTFLELNRSWQKTATALGVHKHTVIYRIKRIEELSGRKVANTGDLAVLWLALQADELSQSRP